MAKPNLSIQRSGAGDQGAQKARDQAAASAERDGEPRRVKMTISMDADLLHELRVMASELPAKDFPSISGFIVGATLEAVERVREERNEGKPFESDEPPKVRTGRRPGS